MKMIRLLPLFAFLIIGAAVFGQNSTKSAVVPFLGVSTTDYPELEEGVLIEGVYKGFGAESAGLQRGDILLFINNDDVNSTRELTKELRGYKIGDEVDVKFMRFNKESTVKIKLSEKPPYESNLKMATRDEASGKNRSGKKAFMGIYPATDWQKGGVCVTGFTNKSVARKAGLEMEDIITKLDETPISTADQLNNFLWTKTPNSELNVTFLRNNKEKTLKMTLGEQEVSENNTNYFYNNGDGGSIDYNSDGENNGSKSGESMENFGERMAKFNEEMAEFSEKMAEKSEKMAEKMADDAENWARDFEKGWNQGSTNRRRNNDWNDGGGTFFSLKEFSATPNPTAGNLTISFSGRSNQPFSVVLSNEDGKEIAREERDELEEGIFTQQFDLSKEPAGVYYVRIYKGEDVITSQKVEKK